MVEHVFILFTDWKCTLTLFDSSTDGEGEGIDMVIFRPEAEMPQFGARDVVVIHRAKVRWPSQCSQSHSHTILGAKI